MSMSCLHGQFLRLCPLRKGLLHVTFPLHYKGNSCLNPTRRDFDSLAFAECLLSGAVSYRCIVSVGRFYSVFLSGHQASLSHF